jgi:glycosyltransferase involved in cell wall biosynthesis
VHIVNIMLSRIAGGIEQAFVDYCEGLQQRGHRITAITHPNAAINKDLRALEIEPVTLQNFGEWDVLAARRLRRQLLTFKPDIVLTHASRALQLARKAVGKDYPLVGVAHNYNTRMHHLAKADGAFAITHDLIKHLSSLGVQENRIFHIPNMVRCHELPHRESRHRPPVIGSMGRFVKKKGFDIYIDALTLLMHRGYNFKAVLAGSGIEERALKKKAREAGLEDVLDFPGWIADKREFYNGIDIFCLPSLHEPFGIVLLEAFIHGVPVISTDSEGPRDFITPNFDALVVRTDSSIEIADAMAKLLDGEHLADELAANAFAKAKTTYSIGGISERIEKALLAVITRWRSERLSGHPDAK